MPGKLGFTILDYSREKSTLALATGNITAVSIAGTLTQVGALRTAIDGIILGVISDERLSVFETNLSNIPPVSELAQIESAWLVQYEDNQAFFDPPDNAIPNEGFGKLFTMTIGTADIVGRLLPASDEADLTDTQIAAFITAFEAIARSPYGGTVNVTRITFVGRNR